MTEPQVNPRSGLVHYGRKWRVRASLFKVNSLEGEIEWYFSKVVLVTEEQQDWQSTAIFAGAAVLCFSGRRDAERETNFYGIIRETGAECLFAKGIEGRVNQRLRRWIEKTVVMEGQILPHTADFNLKATTRAAPLKILDSMMTTPAGAFLCMKYEIQARCRLKQWVIINNSVKGLVKALSGSLYCAKQRWSHWVLLRLDYMPWSGLMPSISGHSAAIEPVTPKSLQEMGMT